jgi:hypothetical protein
LTASQLVELEQFGLVSAGPTGHFDADAVVTAATLGELLALGLEPRHLRPFRTAADREAALLGQLVAPQARQRGPGARQRAEEVASGHAATLIRLHALLLRSALRRELNV